MKDIKDVKEGIMKVKFYLYKLWKQINKTNKKYVSKQVNKQQLNRSKLTPELKDILI